MAEQEVGLCEQRSRQGRWWGYMQAMRSAVECQAGDRLGGRWIRVSEGHTHHRSHVSCFSLLSRRSWQALCTDPVISPSNTQPLSLSP